MEVINGGGGGGGGGEAAASIVHDAAGGNVGWVDPQPDNRGIGIGRHRISVELMRLEQEAKFLEEELEEVEKTERVSAGLQGLIYTIESQPDPLLPITTGPASETWDRWFERPKEMSRCGCWFI